MRLYLSVFAVMPDISPSRPLQQLQNQLISDLRTNELSFFLSEPFPGYDRVFAELDACDLLVAMIDEYWTSSTWKMRELFYASGASAEKDGKRIEAPKPCIVYDTTGNVNVRNILARPDVLTFDGTWDNCRKVINQIRQKNSA